MYAIVDIDGQQMKVEKDQQVFIPAVEGKEGAKIEFDKVLLIEDKGKIVVGSPEIKNIKISAEILEHGKGDKIIVFKKKRRKGYKVKNGHRQKYTKVLIKKIGK